MSFLENPTNDPYINRICNDSFNLFITLKLAFSNLIHKKIVHILYLRC